MSSVLKSKISSKLDYKKSILSFLIIVSASFVAMQIPFREILGSDKSFTLFDFLAPTFGALWGTTVGIVSILVVNITNLVISGDYSISAFIRLLPVLFAIYHFSKRSKASSMVGLIAMALFIVHPVGRAAWYYSLYWLIPLVSRLVSKDNVFTSALGATFTQHAVGSVAFLYAYGYDPAFWRGLVPVVAGERLLLAVGIAGCYIAVKAMAKALEPRVGFLGVRTAENVLKVE